MWNRVPCDMFLGEILRFLVEFREIMATFYMVGGGLDGTFCPSANVQGGIETQNIGGLDKYRAKSYRHTLKDRPV